MEFVVLFLALIFSLGVVLQIRTCRKFLHNERVGAGDFFVAGVFLGAGYALAAYTTSLAAFHSGPDLLGAALFCALISGLANVLYFIPSIVASQKAHHNATAILALNFLLGWSFLGWVGAFVWALTSTSRDVNLRGNESLPAGTRLVLDDGKVACGQCGRRFSRAFICTDGRCQNCYRPAWLGTGR